MDLISIKTFLENNSIPFIENEPMHKHTSFKTGGVADIFVNLENVEQLKNIMIFGKENSVSITIMGNGSNILVGDSGIREITVCLSGLNKISVMGNAITCGAGVALSLLCNTALQNSLTGLEFAYGIPGSVGGAVYMNAGAYGGEIKDVITSCTVIDKNGKISVLSADQLMLGYRTSVLKTEDLILIDACFTLQNGEKDIIKSKMTELFDRRRQKQPLDYPSAGSTFKRPEDYFAGTLIEQCGLKGKRIGGAMVSQKHAGFIINYENATTKDIKELISFVQKTVFEKLGVKLEREVIYIGQD